MASWVILVGIGFLGWWATGIDDVLSLSLLMKRMGLGPRRALVLGNVLGVGLVLIPAILIVLGVISLAPGLLQTSFLGILLQNWAGIIPVVIGIRALYMTLRGDDDDDLKEPPAQSLSQLAKMVFLGFQIYLLNSFDDISVHLGVLGGAVKPPLSAMSAIPIIAYSIGVFLGEATSVFSAGWLARRMEAQRTLEIVAAVVIIVVGLLVMAGVF